MEIVAKTERGLSWDADKRQPEGRMSSTESGSVRANAGNTHKGRDTESKRKESSFTVGIWTWVNLFRGIALLLPYPI